MRRADLIGEVVGMAAAAGGEYDDAGDLRRIGPGERQRAPSPGRVPEHDGAVRPDEGLPAQIVQRRGNLPGGGAPGTGIIGLVAAALVLEIFSAGRAMARTLRHQHRKPRATSHDASARYSGCGI